MEVKNKIWFDVTTSLNWTRQPVGIVRTEQMYAIYAKDVFAEDVVFCKYDKMTKAFLVVDTDLRQLFSKRSNASSGAAEIELNFMPPSWHLRIYRKLRSHGVIVEPKNGAKGNIMHQLLSRAKFFNGSNKKAVPVKEVSPVEVKPIKMERGDVIVSIGLDWDDKDYDVLYDLKSKNGIKVVTVCYDLIPVLLPHLCANQVFSSVFFKHMINLAWVSDLVFPISESSKKDFIEFVRMAGAPCPETHVIELGNSTHHVLEAKISQEIMATSDEPFLLFVSTIERRKNHEIIYRAYLKLLEKGAKLPKVIFVGMQGWGVGDFMTDLKLDPRVKSYFKLLNHVSDAELDYLYRKCLFTLYPSFYEGWGLPVSESLSHGKFCIASSSSSLPEVGRNFVAYADPLDVNQWADLISRYVSDADALKKAETFILSSYRPKTWESSAQDFFSKIKQL